MLIDTDIGPYRWIEDWARIPDSPLGTSNGRTHGVVATRSGNIIVFHQAAPAVLTYSPAGELLDAWGNYPGAHGMTLVEENGTEFLWLTDQETRVVEKTTLAGEVVQSLPPPDHAAYTDGDYIPTWAAVNPESAGGNGDIWVTDGYGCGLVHRYDRSGRYLSSIDGSEGTAGRFRCPHGIWIGVRQGEVSLYVADRGNQQVQVYDMAGQFVRAFGDRLNSPDVFATHGEGLLIPELNARLTILDGNDQVVAQLGVNDAIAAEEGWPNRRDLVKAGVFNSPHGAAADAAGNIYVVEWITGGRIIKLEKL